MLSVPLYRGWKFVKCQIEWSKKKKTKCILLFYFSRVHRGCHLILKCFEYIKNEMVWILLLVHITLHGMIGGLLKHFPKAVCGIIFFICKSILNVKKESCFLSQSQSICHIYAHHKYKSNFKLREQDFFFLFSSVGCLFLSLALIRKCSQHGIVITRSHSVQYS